MAEARAAITTVLLRLMAESGGTARWYYRDQAGKEQGPFDSDQMDRWSSGFPDDLWIRSGAAAASGEVAEWVPLCDVSPNIFKSSMRQDVEYALDVLRGVHADLGGDGATATNGATSADAVGATAAVEGAGASKGQKLGHKIGGSNMRAGRKHHSRNSTWIKQIDDNSGHEFFYDTASGKSEWQLPPGETL
jgi:hypothetical protein